MGMLLKNVKDINALMSALKLCKGDVLLRSTDGTETFNMKSVISMYLGLANLLKDHGDTYEFYCTNMSDEQYLFEFFDELKSE